jgi:two-component system NtrC family response regulator
MRLGLVVLVPKPCFAGRFRELQNRVKRAVIVTDGKRLTEKDLELIELVKTPSAATLKEARKSVERERIQYTLKKHLGGIGSTAAELGISRPTLYELMKKLGLKKPKFWLSRRRSRISLTALVAHI